MECECFPNNGPQMTPEPHLIPGYMGYVPQYKYKFGNTYGMQTNRIYLDPCINMSPRAVLADICPEDCNTGGFLQSVTGYKYGQCGCPDPYNCKSPSGFGSAVNPGYQSKTPRFQTIMNQTYAPFCNRFCTRTFEQDQWRDKLLTREKEAMDGWRFCYKSKPWERPERTKPWDGDHGGVSAAGDGAYGATSVSYNDGSSNANIIRTNGSSSGPFTGGITSKPKASNIIKSCGPCDQYQSYMKKIEKDAARIGLAGSVQYPQFMTPQGRIMEESFCESLPVLEKLNKDYMSRAPAHALEGILEELGELPIITLHKLQQKREDTSGKFYADERGLATVCNPIGSSYLTARPFRCNPHYRYCEPVNGSFSGHVPGEQFIVGQHRGKVTRNATKYMTYRV